MVKLVEKVGSLTPRKILLIGDFMLDDYTVGKVKRISPEAPVPVMQVQQRYDRPGGAGNVALNFVSLGLSVIAVGRIGADTAGERIRETFQQEKVSTEGLFVQPQYTTPVKNRLIADNQQLLRLDFEEETPLPFSLEEQVLHFCRKCLKDVDVVALSDYGKGFLTESFLQRLLALTKEYALPVIVDPKGKDFTKYRGATVIKPNLSEAITASHKPASAPLKEIAMDLITRTEAEALFITKSDKGISLYFQDQREEHFPVSKIREVRDVTGAGDTVLAVLACSLANRLALPEAARLSNIAASIAVEQVGCARVSLADIARRLYEEDVQNKICDSTHLFLVETLLKDNPYILFTLASDQNIDKEFFKALHRVSGHSDLQIVVFLHKEEDLDSAHFLASLEEVHFLIKDEACLQHLIGRYPPREIIRFSAPACSQNHIMTT